MLLVIILLALGTYLLRLSGVLLRDRLALPAPVLRLLPAVATTLIIALAVQSTVSNTPGFGGYARLLGVALGAVLAWRGASFMVVVITAAAATALLRLLGVA